MCVMCIQRNAYFPSVFEHNRLKKHLVSVLFKEHSRRHTGSSQLVPSDPRWSQLVPDPGDPMCFFFVPVNVPENSGSHLLSPNIAASPRRQGHPSWSQLTQDDPRLSQVALLCPARGARYSGPHFLSPNIAAAARRHRVNADEVEVDRLLATPVLSAM